MAGPGKPSLLAEPKPYRMVQLRAFGSEYAPYVYAREDDAGWVGWHYQEDKGLLPEVTWLRSHYEEVTDGR